MPTPLEIIDGEAMNLPPREPADLVDRLWLRVCTPEEHEAAWGIAVRHRIEQINAGQVTCRPWHTVMEELRARYG